MRLPSLRLPRVLKLGPRRWSEALAVNSKLLVAAPLAFTLIVGTGVIARSHRSDEDGKQARPAAVARVASASKVEAAPAPAPAPVESEPSSETVPPTAEEPKSARKEPKAPHRPKTQTSKAVAPRPATEAEAAPTVAPKSRDPETVAAIAPPPLRDGTVNIIALPWAEVFIDGGRLGVSPPLKVISLKPGKHKVELRNGSFPPYVQTVELRSGTEINITHRFRR
jgi:hypothetical protein